MKRLFYLFILLGALFFGYKTGKAPLEKKISIKAFPDKEFPLSEHKEFVVILYASNDALWCEKALSSVFEQDYENYRVIFVDDGSSDNTYEKASSFILENHQDHRVILARNEKKLGKVGALYRAVDTLLDQEIVLLLDAKDLLSHPGVFTRLNASYQNPDVWMTLSSSISYPKYEIKRVHSLKNTSSFEKDQDHLISFYAALFKQIQLTDLLDKGKFSDAKGTFLQPLFELAGKRIRIFQEPMHVINDSIHRVKNWKAPEKRYSVLAQFPKPFEQKEKTDLLIFSFDRPLQLFSYLESVYRFMNGIEKITVLYRTSHEGFEKGYEVVQANFPKVSFIQQSTSRPKKDFKPNVLKALFGSKSKYVLFAVDDLIVKDFVDLNFCMEAMEKTGAYGFYLRFGKNICFCYQNKEAQKVPPSLLLFEKIYAWDFQKGEHDWGFPNSVDMTLFRKEDLKKPFEKMNFKNPTSLEYIWATEFPPKKGIGLYFEHSKVVNLPLNITDKTGNPHMGFLSTEELLVKFEEGFKLDIDPLYKVENPSPHFDYKPEFTLR